MQYEGKVELNKQEFYREMGIWAVWSGEVFNDPDIMERLYKAVCHLRDEEFRLASLRLFARQRRFPTAAEFLSQIEGDPVINGHYFFQLIKRSLRLGQPYPADVPLRAKAAISLMCGNDAVGSDTDLKLDKFIEILERLKGFPEESLLAMIRLEGGNANSRPQHRYQQQYQQQSLLAS